MIIKEYESSMSKKYTALKYCLSKFEKESMEGITDRQILDKIRTALHIVRPSVVLVYNEENHIPLPIIRRSKGLALDLLYSHHEKSSEKRSFWGYSALQQVLIPDKKISDSDNYVKLLLFMSVKPNVYSPEKNKSDLLEELLHETIDLYEIYKKNIKLSKPMLDVFKKSIVNKLIDLRSVINQIINNTRLIENGYEDEKNDVEFLEALDILEKASVNEQEIQDSTLESSDEESEVEEDQEDSEEDIHEEKESPEDEQEKNSEHDKELLEEGIETYEILESDSKEEEKDTESEMPELDTDKEMSETFDGEANEESMENTDKDIEDTPELEQESAIENNEEEEVEEQETEDTHELEQESTLEDNEEEVEEQETEDIPELEQESTLEDNEEEVEEQETEDTHELEQESTLEDNEEEVEEQETEDIPELEQESTLEDNEEEVEEQDTEDTYELEQETAEKDLEEDIEQEYIRDEGKGENNNQEIDVENSNESLVRENETPHHSEEHEIGHGVDIETPDASNREIFDGMEENFRAETIDGSETFDNKKDADQNHDEEIDVEHSKDYEESSHQKNDVFLGEEKTHNALSDHVEKNSSSTEKAVAQLAKEVGVKDEELKISTTKQYPIAADSLKPKAPKNQEQIIVKEVHTEAERVTNNVKYVGTHS